MKKLIIILKILGYICLAYSINLIWDGSYFPWFIVSHIVIGIVLLLISEALSLRKCKKDKSID